MALVTGAAGFIGSHLTDALLDAECHVIGLDNLSTGSLANLRSALQRPNFEFRKGEMLSLADLHEALRGVDLVFHLAANPDVRVGATNTKLDLDQNILATYTLLEAMRGATAKELAFTSTSTIYGEPTLFPTPEEYGPLLPISMYGASKLAAEGMITAYASLFGWRVHLFRLANIVGSRSQHGVIHDFLRKLRTNSSELEVLGKPPGTVKSYCHVEDTVAGMLAAVERSAERIGTFNISSDDTIDVEAIARIVCEELGLSGVELRWTGGVDGGRGWKGDALAMHLANDRLKRLGWVPKYTSADALRAATREQVRLGTVPPER